MRPLALRMLLFTVTAATLTGCGTPLFRRQAVDHYVKGQLLADRGKVEAALKELAKAVQFDPDLSVAHAAMGDIHRKQGNLDEAVGSYQAACKSDPYAFRPHYNLAVTYQFLAEAAKALEKMQQNLRLAVQVYLRALTIEPADFEANLNLSACYFQLGKYDLAEQYCSAAIKINSERPEAYSNLGVIYDAQNKFYEAIKAYKDSLEVDTHQPNLLLNLGSTYLRQGRTKQAIRTFRLAAKEDPTLPAPWEQIGSGHYHLREFDEAMEAFRTALSLDPASARAHRGVGVVYMSQYILDRRKEDLREKALAAWHVSLEYEPNQDDLRQLLQKYAHKAGGPEL